MFTSTFKLNSRYRGFRDSYILNSLITGSQTDITRITKRLYDISDVQQDFTATIDAINVYSRTIQHMRQQINQIFRPRLGSE